MLNEHSKKIKFFIILFILIIIGLVIYISPNSSEQKRLKQCQDEINSMSYNQLLNKVETMEDNVILKGSGVQKKEYTEALVIEKMICLMDNETDQSIKNNIYDDTMAFVSQNSPEIFYQYQDYLKNHSKNFYDDFFNALTLDNYQDYCPEKLPLLCQKIVVDEITKGWCSEICSTLDQYKNNNNLLRDYVLNFEPEEIQNRSIYIVSLALKLALAFQYNDNNLAKELCVKIDKFDSIEGLDCRTLSKKMEIRISNTCDQINHTLSQLLCETKFDFNY